MTTKKTFSLVNKIVSCSKPDFSTGIHTFVNPYSYNLLRNRNDLFSSFSSISVDGISLVRLLNILTNKKIERKSFDMTSVAPSIFKCASEAGQSIAFLGSQKLYIEQFVSVIRESYPNLNVCFYRDGYFSDDHERQSCIDELVSINPHYIIAGMGTLVQERFLVDVQDKGWKGVGFTCGGFIHQTAKGIDYYPDFFDRYNCRWLYRIYDEPKLFVRYFFHYPVSIVKITYDCFKYKNE